MKLFYTKQIQEIDDYTVQNEPISSLELMERAASAMTYEIIARWKRHIPVVVFAGPGNNGGDALAVARMLREEGYLLEVYLFNPLRKLSANCAKNKERLKSLDGVSFTEVLSEFNPPSLTEESLVIDGLFGIGLHAPLSGGYGALVEFINDSPAKVVSLDIPSGLFAENNLDNISRYIVKADLTLTCQFPKLSFLFAENEKFVGEWIVLDIGFHPEVIKNTDTNFYFTEFEDVVVRLKTRNRFAGKYDMGHVLLVAGSYGMMGAAVLSARSAVHAGAGLVSVHAPRCGYTVLQQSVPEALFQADKEEMFITEIPVRKMYETVAVGPGAGRNPVTLKAIEALLLELKRPAVIDADALNVFVDQLDLLARLPANSIITPHVREFDRLFGKHDTAYQRLFKARDVAKQYHIIVILKGANSAVVTPKGEVWFNSTGNPGMATGGTGDVLTGILAGLLAQGYSSKDSALVGTFVHGLAGDLALEQESEEYISAADIVSYIGKAFRKIKTYK